MARRSAKLSARTGAPSRLVAERTKGRLCLRNDRETFDRRAGEILRRRRQNLGLTLQQTSTVVGICFQQLYKYETGKSSLPLWRAFQLCEVLSLNISDFIPKWPRRTHLRLSIPTEVTSDYLAREICHGSDHGIPISKLG